MREGAGPESAAASFQPAFISLSPVLAPTNHLARRCFRKCMNKCLFEPEGRRETQPRMEEGRWVDTG